MFDSVVLTIGRVGRKRLVLCRATGEEEFDILIFNEPLEGSSVFLAKANEAPLAYPELIESLFGQGINSHNPVL